jgi:4-amino-4-deoxy-L-arabinose transferase-like glycosyltransferase
MFRFNNPDAALTFLLVAAAYALTRAVQRGGTGWLVGAAVLLGTAFLAKSLQAVLVLPGLALAFVVCAPGRAVRRIGQLLAAGVALLVSGLWWPLLVDAIPAGSRPYAGGSTTNSVMELILGYNGLGRITGQEGGPGGSPGSGGAGRPGGGAGGGFGGGFGGAAGWDRMFNTQFAGFIAWFIPAAIIGLIAGLWLLRRTREPGRALGGGRTDPRLASLIIWGGWTAVTAGVFSFAGGIIHTYYTVALAPGVAALAGMTLPALWRRRAELVPRVLLAVSAVATAITTFWLLGRPPGWLPWLAWTVLVVGVVAAVLIVVGRLPRRVATVAGLAALAAGIAGPLAWSLATIGTTHTGSIPTAGPARMAQAGFGGPGGAPGGFRRADRTGQRDVAGGSGAQPGQPSQPGQAGQAPAPPGQGLPGGGPFFQSGGTATGGGMRGGPGEASTANPELTALLSSGASGYRWAAAAPSSMTAGPLQLAANVPVMSLGGFSGGDAAITLDGFKALVAAHEVHYFMGGGAGGGPGGERGATTSIASWVSSTFSSVTVGSTTVYDLSKPTAAS